jgi:EF hand
MKTLATMFTALALISSAAIAQTTSGGDAIAQKFATLDIDKSGFLEGKELDPLKDKMAILDMDKDGKVSAQEFNIGVMTGVIS